MGMGMIVALGIASILFFSVLLITAALMMRGQLDSLGGRARQPTEDQS